MDGLCLKGHAGTVDHPGGCPGNQEFGPLPHIVGKGKEEASVEHRLSELATVITATLCKCH